MQGPFELDRYGACQGGRGADLSQGLSVDDLAAFCSCGLLIFLRRGWCICMWHRFRFHLTPGTGWKRLPTPVQGRQVAWLHNLRARPHTLARVCRPLPWVPYLPIWATPGPGLQGPLQVEPQTLDRDFTARYIRSPQSEDLYTKRWLPSTRAACYSPSMLCTSLARR